MVDQKSKHLSLWSWLQIGVSGWVKAEAALTLTLSILTAVVANSAPLLANWIITRGIVERRGMTSLMPEIGACTRKK